MSRALWYWGYCWVVLKGGSGDVALPVVTVSRIVYRQNKKNTCAVSVVGVVAVMS